MLLPLTLFVLCLALAFGASCVVADDSPRSAFDEPGRAARRSAGLIYPLEDRPTPQCHASTIAQSTDGGLVASWFGGAEEGDEDVGIWVSRRIDGKWARPVEVATGAEGESRDHPCWNPVLFQPTQGPLMLFYKVGPTPRSWWGVQMTSDDGGATWGHRRRLGKDAAVGHLVGPVKNKPIERDDGSILCPSSTEHDGWRVHFEITDDLGATWRVIGPIHDGAQFDAIQPSILDYGDGRLQVLCRTRQSVLGQAWSENGGDAWSKISAMELPNPSAGVDAVTLQDGRQLLVYNHTSRAKGFPRKRNMLNVAFSRDGRQWHAALVLELDQGEYSYPSVIQATDGRVHVTYTWRRQSVKHVVIDPAKLRGAPIVDGAWPIREAR
ncbi:MAG: sialidase [Phycisphaeraceae bacterium]|nr:sialidase [Phycisphaeraceae bacterium]